MLNLLKKNINDDYILIIIPYDLNSIDDYIELCDNVLLVGGDDIPPRLYNQDILFDNVIINNTRFDFEIEFVKKFINKNKPLLGICAGMQLINIVLGGSLYQDIEKQLNINSKNHIDCENLKNLKHNINIDQSSKLYDILQKSHITTNSIHHQSIKILGNNLKISAESDDNIIEAIEYKNHKFCLGLQWHPEIDPNEHSDKIIKSFIYA